MYVYMYSKLSYSTFLIEKLEDEEGLRQLLKEDGQKF